MKAPPSSTSFLLIRGVTPRVRSRFRGERSAHATVQRVHARKSSVLSLTPLPTPRACVPTSLPFPLFHFLIQPLHRVQPPLPPFAFSAVFLPGLLLHSSSSSFPRHSFTAFVSRPFLFLLCLYLPYSTSGFARLLVLFISFSASLSERSGGSDKFHKRHGRCRDGAKAQRDYPL